MKDVTKNESAFTTKGGGFLLKLGSRSRICR